MPNACDYEAMDEGGELNKAQMGHKAHTKKLRNAKRLNQMN